MNESTDTLALTEFLLARIADDEAVAREATRGPWESEVGGSEGYYLFGPRGLNARLPQRRDRIASVTWGSFDSCKADGAHIARFDPARALAECAAKRLIVSHMQIVAGIVGPRGEDARAVLTWLALPYADHAEFRRKWRPSVPLIPPPNPHLAATVDGEPSCPL